MADRSLSDPGDILDISHLGMDEPADPPCFGSRELVTVNQRQAVCPVCGCEWGETTAARARLPLHPPGSTKNTRSSFLQGPQPPTSGFQLWSWEDAPVALRRYYSGRRPAHWIVRVGRDVGRNTVADLLDLLGGLLLTVRLTGKGEVFYVEQ